MSIARRTFPSRLELKRRAGSFRDAPLAKVSFTTFLQDSPVQMIPSCDHTGVPIHFHSSTTSGSASLMSLRILLKISPRQSPGWAILLSISSDADCLDRARLFHILLQKIPDSSSLGASLPCAREVGRLRLSRGRLLGGHFRGLGRSRGGHDGAGGVDLSFILFPQVLDSRPARNPRTDPGSRPKARLRLRRLIIQPAVGCQPMLAGLLFDSSLEQGRLGHRLVDTPRSMTKCVGVSATISNPSRA